MKLTIFTPTYNRAHCLDRLYKSLISQTNKSFKWIIVDDGSTDKTENLVNGYIQEKKLEIEYYKQLNMGKHVAHNKGVEMCNTELFFCVDSDDLLTNDAVESILDKWDSIDKSKSYVGIVALKGDQNGFVDKKNQMPKNLNESTLSDLYNIHGKKGETALIFKTSYLKKRMFPVFGKEKFLSEEVLYNELDMIAPLIILNKVIYLMEYLDDGITKNYIKFWKSSPEGTLYLLNSRYKVASRIKGMRKIYRTVRVMLVRNAFCISLKIPILKNSPNKLLSIMLILPSKIVSIVKFK